MVEYFRTPEMQSGQGFRCYTCGKLLAIKIKGPCVISFVCPRCKTYIFMKMKEAPPWTHKDTPQELDAKEAQTV